MADIAPPGWHTVTPRLFVDDVPAMVSWLTQTFDASGELQEGRPSEILIGDSIVMIADTSFRGAMTSCLYVYVEDVDTTYKNAVDAGASTMEAVMATPYGDRRCMVEDPFGNIWQIATRGD